MARRAAALVATLLLLGVAARPAAAHVDLQAAEPAPDATVEAPPPRVVLQFGDDVSTGPDALVVLGPDGGRVDDGEVQRPAPDQVAVGLRPGLPPGVYTVQWQILAPDGDVQEGGHQFTATGGATTTTTTSPATTADGSATTQATDGDRAEGDGDGGTPAWLVVLLGLLAVAALVGGIAGIRRSRRRT
jgi:methionine-rich copper-binding protein CopC